MLNCQTITGKLDIRITRHLAEYPPNVERKIAEIWKQEKKKRQSKLFNGKILSLSHFEKSILTAQIVEYRSYLAQVLHPELFDVLQVRLLAVSGLTTCGSKIVFGKRAKYVTQDANKWELVPSGGFTPNALDAAGNLSVGMQISEELEAELGISQDYVTCQDPFLLVEDLEHHVIDIGVEIKLRENILEKPLPSQKRSDEYSEIRWVDVQELQKFFETERENHEFVLVTLALLQAKNLISP